MSSLTGRIRLRDQKLRDHAVMSQLKAELSNIVAITRLEENSRTGSLLVRYDRQAAELSCLEAQINRVVDQVVGMPKPFISKKNINRYNKIAMLATLGASLSALAIARRKPRIRWHRLTGYLFLANLGVHLFIYRKSLFRLLR